MPHITLFQSILLIFVGFRVVRYLHPEPIDSISLLYAKPYLFGAFLIVFIYALDRCYLYPRHRNPLRKFPIVKLTNVITERPRGARILNEFQAHPNADAVVMRSPLGKCILLPASPDALRDILNTHSYSWNKPWGIRAFLGRVIGFGLVLSEGDAHKMQRKALTPAFNLRNIKALYPLMRSTTELLADQLEQESDRNGEVEITHWASRFTLDIIGAAALSRSFSTLTSDHDPVAEAFGEVLDPSPELVTFMLANQVFPQWIMTRLPVKANRLIRNQCSKLRTLCRNILAEKRDMLKQVEEGKVKASEEDILQNIVSSGQFSDEEVVDQMLTFLAAGHETTSSALTWCIYLLGKNPETQQRLRQEIEAHKGAKFTPSLLEAMPVLNAVCEETFRLFPTVPLTIREAQCNTIVAGVAVPKGTLAMVAPYAINRHPLSWGENAEEFTPDRWIDQTSDGEKLNKHGGSFSNFCESTFLHGPRSCIGRDFAKAELRCAVAGLLDRFDIELVDPTRQIVIGGTVTTKPVGGLKVRLRSLHRPSDK